MALEMHLHMESIQYMSVFTYVWWSAIAICLSKGATGIA